MAISLPLVRAQPTALVGRTAELDAIDHLLNDRQIRLLSLLGPAGVGKTRLALEAASRLEDRFSDGVTFVDLSSVLEPNLVLPAIAQALGLIDTGFSLPLPRLQDYLRDRRALLVLDNFEQVLGAGGEIAELLAAARELKVLVTSRDPLRLRWESTLRILPLPIPDHEDNLPIDRLVHVPSVALLLDRIHAQQATFIPTEREAPILSRLTRRLDGLPLAIELAAATTSVLPLEVIADRLDRHLYSLVWEAQDLPDRQRSLQAAIGWSYELLSDQEQQLFRRLGVFVGRVSLRAIEAVMGDAANEGTLTGLVSLAEKSLVLPIPSGGHDVEPSFVMLETVRQYAREQLEARGELLDAVRTHARYFGAFAEQADSELRGRNQLTWYIRLEAEHDNLRAALRWLLDRGGSEQALRLAAALAYFWWLRGYHGEGWRWLDEALKKATDVDCAVRIKALGRGGTLLMYGGDVKQSEAVLEEAVALARGHALHSAIPQPLAHLGLCAAIAGDLGKSLLVLQEARVLAQKLQDDHQLSFTLAALGYQSLAQGNYEDAAHFYADAVSRFREVGNEASATVVQFSLAVTMRHLNRWDEAIRLLQESLRTTLAFQNRWQLCHGIEATVALVGDHADPEERMRLLGVLDTLTWTTGAKYGTLARVAGPDGGTQTQLPGQEQLDLARRAGRSLPFHEAVALALDVLYDFSNTFDRSETVLKESARESQLSPREREVLQLVAEGKTSKQIGRELFLSPKTVDRHLYVVFNKLGVESRAQAVAVAARHGLL